MVVKVPVPVQAKATTAKMNGKNRIITAGAAAVAVVEEEEEVTVAAEVEAEVEAGVEVLAGVGAGAGVMTGTIAGMPATTIDPSRTSLVACNVATITVKVAQSPTELLVHQVQEDMAHLEAIASPLHLLRYVLLC